MKIYLNRLHQRYLSLFIVLLGMAALTGCSPKPVQFHSMDVTGAQWGQGFSLPNLQGQNTSLADFQDKVVIVFFGFLYCPDACPSHLSKMLEVRERLGSAADRLSVVFITLDPERDQPEALAAFLAAFHPDFVGLRGSLDQTQSVAKDFRVYFKKVPSSSAAKDPMAYTIDHTTFAYLFDPRGQLRLVAPHDIPVDKLTQDIENLLGR